MESKALTPTPLTTIIERIDERLNMPRKTRLNFMHDTVLKAVRDWCVEGLPEERAAMEKDYNDGIQVGGLVEAASHHKAVGVNAPWDGKEYFEELFTQDSQVK